MSDDRTLTSLEISADRGAGTITLTATGASTDIDVDLVPKGTGQLKVNGDEVPTLTSGDARYAPLARAAYACTVEVDFGGGASFIQVDVEGQAWVTEDSIIVATLVGGHHTEEAQLGCQFFCAISELVAGVGFRLNVYSATGASDVHVFNCIGVA